MVRRHARGDDRDMTQAPHDTAPGGGGPRVPPAQMRDLHRLRRSATDRRIAGVAGGIGRHLDIDPTIIRVLLVVLVFFGGTGALVYGAVWLLVPEDGKDRAPVHLGEETRTVVLLVSLAVAGLLLLGNGWWWGFDTGWPPPVIPLVVIGLLVWLVLRGRRGSAQAPQPPASGHAPAASPQASAPPYPPPQPPPAPRPPRPRALFGLTMGAVLLALGVLAVVEVTGTDLPLAVYPAAALAVVGVALVAGAFVGRSTGLVVTGLLGTVLLAMAVWSPHPRFDDLHVSPLRAERIQDSYTSTAGLIDLDLTDVQNTAALDGRTLDLSLRAGEVRVLVPRDVDVDVTSSAQGGQLDILGRVVNGRDVVNDRSTPDTVAPDLHIDVDMGFGQVRVSRP